MKIHEAYDYLLDGHVLASKLHGKIIAYEGNDLYVYTKIGQDRLIHNLKHSGDICLSMKALSMSDWEIASFEHYMLKDIANNPYSYIYINPEMINENENLEYYAIHIKDGIPIKITNVNTREEGEFDLNNSSAIEDYLLSLVGSLLTVIDNDKEQRTGRFAAFDWNNKLEIFLTEDSTYRMQ